MFQQQFPFILSRSISHSWCHCRVNEKFRVTYLNIQTRLRVFHLLARI